MSHEVDCADALNLWLTAGGQVDQHWQVVMGLGGGAIVLFFSLSPGKRATTVVPFTILVCGSTAMAALWWTLKRLYKVQHQLGELVVHTDVCPTGYREIVDLAGSSPGHAHFAWAAVATMVIALVSGWLLARRGVG